MNTTGYASAATKAAGMLGSPNAVARATEADRLADRMNGASASLSGMVGRLQRAIDRISGSVPTGVDDKAEAPTPSGHVFVMDVGFNNIEETLNRFRNELERLEA